jgi:DNA topoisomerase-1
VGDDGRVGAITSTDINRYLQRVTGGPFTSKTFRTWAATVFATTLFTREERPGSERARRSTVSRIIERVAAELGNTPAVCRKSYVHPAVVSAFTDGRLRSSTPEAVSTAS